MDDDFLHYQIFRSKTASANFIKIAEITDANIATYVDSDVNVDAEKYCYYVLQSDLCGNVSLSATHCTMNLKTSGLDYTINLNWNDYEGWTPDTHFLELWRTENGSPVSLVKSFSNNVINYQDLEVTNGIAVYCYKIKAVNNSTQSECKESWSNESCISFPPTLFFPNAFTPNGDGNNDRFTAVGLYGKSFSLSIYDRWGKLAFQTESQEMGWDGKIKGVDAPEGVYVFRARVVGYKDEVIQKTGTVTLVR
jgi:gliding motility-associated-like protein